MNNNVFLFVIYWSAYFRIQYMRTFFAQLKHFPGIQNDVHFVLFATAVLFFLRKVFMKFLFCLAALSSIYYKWHSYCICVKLLCSISAKLAITFCLPSLLLVRYAFSWKCQSVNRKIQHNCAAFLFVNELSQIPTIHILQRKATQHITLLIHSWGGISCIEFYRQGLDATMASIFMLMCWYSGEIANVQYRKFRYLFTTI